MNQADFGKFKANILLKEVSEIRSEHDELIHSRKLIDLVYEKYNEYEDVLASELGCKRLNRHKVCACICAAIIEAEPLKLKPILYTNLPTAYHRISNYILALNSSLSLLLYFMKLDINLYKETDLHRVTQLLLPPSIRDERTTFSNLVGILHREVKRNKKINVSMLSMLSQVFYFVEAYYSVLLKARSRKAV